MSYHHPLYIHVYNYKVSSTRSSQHRGTKTKRLKDNQKRENKKAEISRVVGVKRQRSQANRYIDDGSALKTQTLRPPYSRVLRLKSPHKLDLTRRGFVSQ